jgi:hypothetical protein
MMTAFLIGQLLVVLFIAVHDWIPLGRLSNRSGIRTADSTAKLLVTTVLSTLPFAVGLFESALHAGGPWPRWLGWYLWITYGLGIYGMLRAWWIPYLLWPDPVRARRYQQRFADTHAFLPQRNGIRPDTLHVGFHVVLITTFALLWRITVSGGGAG